MEDWAAHSQEQPPLHWPPRLIKVFGCVDLPSPLVTVASALLSSSLPPVKNCKRDRQGGKENVGRGAAVLSFLAPLFSPFTLPARCQRVGRRLGSSSGKEVRLEEPFSTTGP